MHVKPVLIIAILFKKRGAIGGMAQRFSVLASELIREGKPFELLTTRSLVSELHVPSRREVMILEDDATGLTGTAWLTAIRTLTKVLLGRYRRVHISGAGGLLEPIFAACRVSSTKVSCTFASRTLEMASYGRQQENDKWQRILDRVDRIDALNPSHELGKWSAKISVSPCSFPSQTNNLPNTFSHRRERVAVFCGALEKNKNPILALDIVDQYIRATGDLISLIVFGKGSLLSEVARGMKEINNRHGQGTVLFGNSRDLGRTLSTASVFLSLQEIDNYPSQSVLEAMLMGCKVIATDGGDTKLLFPLDEKRNVVVDSRDPGAFVDAMRVVLADDTASYVNSQFIRETHTMSRFAEYFLAFTDD